MLIQRVEENFDHNEDIKVYRHLHTTAEPVHKHEFYEIAYIYSGGGWQTVNDKRAYVKRGDLLVLDSNDTHSFVPDGSMGVMNCLVVPRFLSEQLAGSFDIADILSVITFRDFGILKGIIPIIPFSNSSFFEIESLMDSMENEFSGKRPGYRTVIKSYLQVLFVKIFRKMREMDSANIIRSVNKIAPEVLQYIEENYNKKIVLKELAEMCFYTPTYFSKVFKECYGKSLTHFVNELRVAEAVKLLHATHRSTSDIGEEVGFSDKKQFYKIFKEYTGKTPGEYRK